jgi:CRP/FNR family transcriptional regulator, cyclic AMP receptor protein
MCARAVTSPKLADVPLFQGLARDELARVTGLFHVRTFPRETAIMWAGQPGDAVYVVLEGWVKVHSPVRGRDVILALLGPGEVVGEMSVVDSLGRSASVVTLEPSTVGAIARSSFWECLRTMPALAFNVATIVSRRVRLANSLIQSLAALEVAGRLSQQLLALAHEYGERTADGGMRISLPLTQTDLADLVGASRVRVNQVLGELRTQGSIELSHDHRVTIRDEDALRRLTV